MTEVAFEVPEIVLRNLADRTYEKRRIAAVELEVIVKSLCAAGEQENVTTIIDLLAKEYTQYPQSNFRKAALIGLTSITFGLAGEAARHLDQIIPPILNSFLDQDIQVRYYACEALYNIAKIVRGEIVVFFNQIFNVLCKITADSDTGVQNASHLLDGLIKDIVTETDQFCIEDFIPLLRERMNVLNPLVRRFLVGWIIVLDGVPDIDLLGFLPDFLDGLFNMLSDSNLEIRQQADSAVCEFLQEIKNSPNVDYGRMAETLVQMADSSDGFTRLTAITWIDEFVKLGGEQLAPYYADILSAVLPCIADKEEKIRVVARETNEEIRSVYADSSCAFDVGSVLTVAGRLLSSEWEATRIEVLHWMSTLFNRYYDEVIMFLSEIFESLLSVLSDPSDEVVLLALDVHTCIARDPLCFHNLVFYLINNFRVYSSLLEARGALIIRRLCILLTAERIYKEFAAILEKESDLNFASIMVQALNLILLTSSELADTRTLLRQSLVNPSGKDLFISLYSSWCHSPVSIVSLCLLAQAYQHASSVIHSLGEEEINVKFLVQLDKLILILETPIFAYLRFQLLEPAQYPWLLKSLYGLLMLLPQQSSAFKTLRNRLKSVPLQTHISQLNEGVGMCQDTENTHIGIDFRSKLLLFQQMQEQRRIKVKTQVKQRLKK
ncbi:VAC14-like protein [Zostera marina]|uniref:VAC14-like protein n=1 Tax=Zostera marina TaxID=29655 RepID=A0A0K9PBB3_ZOSMR|nr:VAC14-like protein [Zostera marina]